MRVLPLERDRLSNLLKKLFTDEKGAIECPWHKYPFDLKTGRYTLGAGDCVETYPIEKRTDGIYIGIKDWSWNIF